MSFIDVSQTGNDTEHHCDQVARFAFRGLCCAAHPIAAVAAFRVFRQKMPAIRARHFIACGRFRLGSGRIRVFHVHTYRKSQAAPNSSSKQNQKNGRRSPLQQDRTYLRKSLCRPHVLGSQKRPTIMAARKARCGYLFPIRVVGVIPGACVFFFGSSSLRKLLAPDLIITRNS